LEETDMKRTLVFAVGALALLALFAAGTARTGQKDDAPKKEPPPKKEVPLNKEEQGILDRAKEFIKAYNARDAKAVGQLFTPDAVVIEYDGDTHEGRKEIEEAFAEIFKAVPKGKIALDVDLVRQLSDTIIVEEGKTIHYPDGEIAGAETQYQVVHVKHDGAWMMKRVRTFEPKILSPYENLQALEWLVGEWVDESPDGLVESNYYWNRNKSFLLHDFTIKLKSKATLHGTQRIGWDPLTKQIKAWVFDSEGGQGESIWTEIDGTWLIRLKGVRLDGSVITANNQLVRVSDERMTITSTDRIAGSERMPDMTVTAVKRPPQPKE
jgi:uncharacterized protein (TIGR02246 family)